MKRALANRAARRGAFSLVEALISSVIFVSMLAVLYGALGDSRRLTGVQGTYAKMEMDARRALEKISDELRMSGHVQNPAPGQPGYPYTFVNGAARGTFNHPARHDPAGVHVEPGTPAFGDCREITFLLPADNDGDGLLTDAATGQIEWSQYGVSYVLVTGPDGINRLERWEDDEVTAVLACYAERVTFDTIDSDPTLAIGEVAITLYMARPMPGMGLWLQSKLATRVTMRNTEGLYRDAPSAI